MSYTFEFLRDCFACICSWGLSVDMATGETKHLLPLYLVPACQSVRNKEINKPGRMIEKFFFVLHYGARPCIKMPAS